MMSGAVSRRSPGVLPAVAACPLLSHGSARSDSGDERQLSGCRRSEAQGRGARPRLHGVVLAHTTSADRCQWLPFARELAKQGYRALVFDMRATARPPASRTPIRTGRDRGRRRAPADTDRAAGRVHGRHGRCRGADHPPGDSGVVELSAPTLFSTANALRRKKLKLALFIAGRDDGDFPRGDARPLPGSRDEGQEAPHRAVVLARVDLVSLPAVRRSSSTSSSASARRALARADSARASPARRRRPRRARSGEALVREHALRAAISFFSRSTSCSTLPSCVTWPGLTTASKIRASSSESSMRTWLRR